jgi:hypothetical protein
MGIATLELQELQLAAGMQSFFPCRQRLDSAPAAAKI